MKNDKKTIYTLDTEFIEDGKTIDLISLALCCEDGRTLYLQNLECNFGFASDWVWRNVFPHLGHFDMRGKRACSGLTESYDFGLSRPTHSRCGSKIEDPCPWRSRLEIRQEVLLFCDQESHGRPEFWGYYADYDWVALCQLFGTMIDLPKGFPMCCRDMKQAADDRGIRLPKPQVDVHHALVDAQLVMDWHKQFIHGGQKL